VNPGAKNPGYHDCVKNLRYRHGVQRWHNDLVLDESREMDHGNLAQTTIRTRVHKCTL